MWSLFNARLLLCVYLRARTLVSFTNNDIYISKVFYLWEKMVLGFRGIYEKKKRAKILVEKKCPQMLSM